MYFNLELLSKEDVKKIKSIGFDFSDYTINKELYQSLCLSNFIGIEIEKTLDEYELSEEEKKELETKLSVELSLAFEPEVKRYLKFSIEHLLFKIIHERKEV